ANADDPQIVSRLGRFGGRVVTFGIEREADVQATSVSDGGIDGFDARVKTAHGTTDVHIPLVGRGNLANVLAAIAVAREAGVPVDAITERTSSLRAPSRRGEVVRLESGVTLVDDSYNANPGAVKGALELIRASPARRRIAVLGEML